MKEELPNWRMPSAFAGMDVSLVDTPALLIDLDALEFNTHALHKQVHAHGVKVRAHAKAHKSVDIARLQIKAGAIGICCQKASEAQVFVEAGIQDVMISNEVMGLQKTDRVALLAREAKISICVDAVEQINQLAQSAKNHGAVIHVYIEIDIGHGRCGVKTPGEALALCNAIKSNSPSLVLAGIHAFRGSAQHMREPAERKAAVDFAIERLREIIKTLKTEGHSIEVVTGGGTGTYDLEASSGVYTEVQPGSYVLMDVDYAANKTTHHSFKHALFGFCTVMSICDTHAVLDGGLKTFAVDLGFPKVVAPGWSVKSMSDEHTVIVPGVEAEELKLGDKLKLIPGHCDPTVNLHDWLIATRGDKVETVWAVSARGALF
jgi:D-serine deaminase-like pyridoxal phosphate-dependent protein